MTADAEVAVEEQRARPPSRTGNPIEHRPGEHRRATPASEVDGGGGDVDAERDDAAFCERKHVAARPATHVEHRSHHPTQQGVVLDRRAARASGARAPAARFRHAHEGRQSPRHERAVGRAEPGQHRPQRRGEPAVGCGAGDGERVIEIVDVA